MSDALEESTTETLLVLRENLWSGLAVIGHTIEAGTFHESKDPVKGSASPAQFGAALVLPLFFKINTILTNRGEEDYTGRLS